MAAEYEGQKGYATAGPGEDIAGDSPIRNELVQLHSQLDRLEHQTGRLRSKLEPALRMVPSENNPGGLQDVAGSQLTQEIRRADRRVREVVDLITETIDQLEV